MKAYIPIFKFNHPTAQIPEKVKFRLRLVRFISLWANRHAPSEVVTPAPDLEKLRHQHQERAESFYDAALDSTFQDDLLEEHLESSSYPKSATAVQSVHETICLADLVPMFIALSAARGKVSQDEPLQILEQWMELAGEFMLQAALQQFLECSNSSGQKIREIFSWGWRPSPHKAWEDEQAVNDMFRDGQDEREVALWGAIRQKYMDLVCVPVHSHACLAMAFSLPSPSPKDLTPTAAANVYDASDEAIDRLGAPLPAPRL